MPTTPLRCTARALLVATLIVPTTLRSAILQSITEQLASTAEHDSARNSSASAPNQIATIDKPARGGKFAFKHSLGEKDEMAELATKPTMRGGTYWYGWSFQLPETFDHRAAAATTIMRLVSASSRRGANLPCGADSSCLRIDEKGRLVFHLQHPGDGDKSICDEFVVLQDVAPAKGRWVDVVMHAKWTDANDGFVELWAKVHDNNFFQRVAFTGRTWWSDEKSGPVFKIGAHRGSASGSAITLYTDELRLGDAASSFDEMAAPGAESRAAEAGRGQVRYVLYPSQLNRAKIAVMVYTPPGYDPGAAKRYPVIYNLHGAGGGSPARQWARAQRTLTHAIESGAVPPSLVVFVNGLGDTGYVDRPGPSDPKVFSSIVGELIPFIDANYATIAERRGRAIEGFSMGGGGAMMIATKRPDLFSSVVAYAGGFMRESPGMPPAQGSRIRELLEQFGHWNLVRRNLEAIRTDLRIRMVCGDQDALHSINVDFKDFLDSVQVPVSWVSVRGVAHDTAGLYNKVGIESLSFIHEGFSAK